MKKYLAIVSVLFTLILTSTVFAGAWVQEGSNWKYKDDNGSFLTSTWKFLQVGNGYGTYYFDENGYMVTGLKRIDGEVHAFRDDGITLTNSTVTIDGEKYETKNKGMVEGLPGDFDVDAYNAKLLAEKQKKEAEEAARLAKQRAIEESIANRTPEEKASIAASEAAEEAAKAASIAAAEAAEEAARIERLNNTIRISKTLPDVVNITGDAGGKITVTLLIPTLIGGNSDAINAVLKDKIKNEVYSIYEEKYGDTSSKVQLKVKDVFLDHSLEQHLLRFHYWDTNGYQMFTLYMDTNTLQMWSD